MAKFYLINNVRVGSSQLFAGSLIDDAFENAAAIRLAGGVLVPSSNGAVAAASAIAQKARKRGAPFIVLAEIMEAALNFTHDRMPKGANLTDAAATIQWSDGLRRVLPAATLTAARVLTLGIAAGADGRLPYAGSRLEITRLDATANTYAVANGGPGAGTLKTFPVSATGGGCFEFDGTNWEMVY